MVVSSGETLLHALFRRLVQSDTLQVTYPSGRIERYGTSGPCRLAMRLTGWPTPWRLVLEPELTFGECYMSGHLVIERGPLQDVLRVLMSDMAATRPGVTQWLLARLRVLMKRVHQFNPTARSRRNVAHHYDLDDGLYDLFLDPDKFYSCAYFRSPEMSLEAAQAAKVEHIIAKLQPQPGQRILDIGSGWGGLAIALARRADVSVLGVTLSERQLVQAIRKAGEAGMSDRVEFRLADYRSLDERFDRIVSVGMFEHVGVSHYQQYFDQVRRLLAPDGIALIHSIGRTGPPDATNPWIAKYIFPGGYIPSLSEVMPAIENSGLLTTDIEILRLHYAYTLSQWSERFAAHRDQARKLYDERFCRMWEFYLAASEANFRAGRMMVFQAQLSASLTAVPLTRDYLYSDSGPANRMAPPRQEAEAAD